MSRLAIECAPLANASPLARAGVPADLAFCHPDIRGVVAIDARAVTLEVSADSTDLRAQVERVVELSIRSYRFVRETPPLWRHDALPRYAGGLREWLAAHTITLGPGQYALVGPAAELRMFIDQRVRAIAATIGAEPWHLPSIEQTDDVCRDTGYLASHGQYVTFGYHLPAHFEQIASFTADVRARKLAWPEPQHELVPSGFILEPFVCHNIYRALKGTPIRGGRAITALGTCYRHEGFRFAPLLRQWEFSMREIVLVGSPAYVSDVRAQLVELAEELARELDLDARLEVATDPFFVSEAASARTYQAMRSTKLELKLGIDAATTTAATSFNLHGTHFTSLMKIGDGAAETACIGFGLERWMAAIVARWGGPPPTLR
ncbi:MAG: hypothetical protein H0T46_32755 [Deltaproteobacteria bacterium]|nr:hypothetical protein [Deltaproteobacteria bacterium]